MVSVALLTGALTVGAALDSSSALAQTQTPPQAQDPAGPALNADVPTRYTVKAGDTLWGISSMYLRDPWLWPEIWYVNPQVGNPHLIYPGDVLVLAYGADGRPQITLERGTPDGSTRLSPRVRSEPLAGAIVSIPYSDIAAFMSRPFVLDKDQIQAAPHVVSSRDQHLATAAGNTIYVKNLDGEVGARYSIVRVGDELRDPDDREVLGRQGTLTATARVTRTGDPATLQITDSRQETYDGDLLFPEVVDMQLNFFPRAPEQEVDGSIIELVNAVSMVGQRQGVVINRGSQHGLEPGHVLAIYHLGPTVRDRNKRSTGDTNRVASSFSPRVKLPDERAGTLMVFKTFDRVSYALVMQSEMPIRMLDRVGNP
jgi:LysM repeat protein